MGCKGGRGHQKGHWGGLIRNPANKECLDVLSQSGDVWEMKWARLASESNYAENKCCSCCEQDLGTRGDMSRHMEKPENATCLQYAGKSGDPKLKKLFDKLTAGGLTLACPCCRGQFPRSGFTSQFKKHIMTTKDIACMEAASKSKDPVVLEIYNNILPLWFHNTHGPAARGLGEESGLGHVNPSITMCVLHLWYVPLWILESSALS